MPNYEVAHQCDFIQIPRHDIVKFESGANHIVYIKIRNMEALDKIIEQCLNLKACMEEENN